MPTHRLILGDCTTELPKLDSGSVDAVVTDPPFGIGFKYASHDDSPEGYGKWLWSILEECERVCRPGAPLFVWQAMLNVRHFAEWFPRDFRIFAAAKNFVQMRPVVMQHAWDPVIVWWKEGGKPYKAESRRVCNRDFHVGDTASVVSKPKALQRKHPCPRPLDQVRYIIQQWVPEGGAVLDPFMGSGTAALACYQTRRRFVGMEIEPAYFTIAEQRLAAAQDEMALFTGATA